MRPISTNYDSKPRTKSSNPGGKDMGRRGPQKTPTTILKRRGSWLVRARAAEPLPGGGYPACPDWMPRNGKVEWRRICRELKIMRILAKPDRALLVAYCVTWAQFVSAAKKADEEGPVIITEKGFQIQNPIIGILNKTTERLEKLAREFGLSPASRAGVNATQAKAGYAAQKSGKAYKFDSA
jgi:P27 family predicted phage terminase small subunit